MVKCLKETSFSRFRPKKYVGQVFLKDKKYLKTIIRAAQLKPQEIVLEIGAGQGVLTEALLKEGIYVKAVEKDKELMASLRQKFQNQKNLTLIEADIRDFLKNPKKFKIHLTRQRYKVVANIPYYLTSHLLKLLLESKNPPFLMVLMVQKEVGERLISQPPKSNLLAIATQYYSHCQLIKKVPKTAFWPQPKVDSAIIRLIYEPKTKEAPPSVFFLIIKAGFSQPRKLVINNLSQKLSLKREIIEEVFQKLNIDLKSRPQNLSLDQWLKLTKELALPIKNKNSLLAYVF